MAGVLVRSFATHFEAFAQERHGMRKMWAARDWDFYSKETDRFNGWDELKLRVSLTREYLYSVPQL